MEKNMNAYHRRLLNEAKEKIKSTAKNVAAVGIANGISAICSAVLKNEDIHDWESDLSSTLAEAIRLLHEADAEIDKAIEIVMENEGADKKGEE